MSVDKHPFIFYCQMEAVTVFQCFYCHYSGEKPQMK